MSILYMDAQMPKTWSYDNAQYKHSQAWVTKRKFFAEFLKKRPSGGRYLDLGAGSGGTMNLIKNTIPGSEVWGADIVVSVRDVSLLPRVKQTDLSRDRLPFSDGFFDVVTAIQVMEHLENPFHFEREIARVLKPGGTLVISFPSGESIWARFNYLVSNNVTGYNAVNNHITFLLRDVFRKTFLADFTHEESFYDGGFVPYVPKWKLPASRWFSKRVCHFLRRKIIAAPLAPPPSIAP